MEDIPFHVPVLLEEAVDALNVKTGEKYIDATLGGAGHSQEIIKRGGIVLGIDADLEAVKFVDSLGLENLTVVQGNFRHLSKIAQDNDFENCSGILFDLGMSSYQLDQPGRGFSFKGGESLDMRMDPGLNVTAADLVNALGAKELADLFLRFGEERWAAPIARAIVEKRKSHPFRTTSQLVGIVEEVVKVRDPHLHPATRIFQALRIAVNDELGALEEGLLQSIEILRRGGRLVVLSFHSLEDRKVKGLRQDYRLRVVQDLVLPTKEEIEINPRAHSAKMRVYEKN